MTVTDEIDTVGVTPAPKRRTPVKKATTTTEDNVSITIPAMDLKRVRIPLLGTAPLIIHKWSEKAKEMMLNKQTQKASTGREAKDPHQDYRDSLYIINGTEDPQHLENEQYGFPCVGFKAAAVRAGTYSEMKMTFLRGAFHVRGEFARIMGTPNMREDMVRIGMGKADIRYRGEFKEWETTLDVEFNAKAISLEQLFNLFEIAGFAVGVGEWRPERDGSYGTFKVKS